MNKDNARQSYDVRVGIPAIRELWLNVLPGERTLASKGTLAFHPDIIQRYREAGYDDAPKSREERDARGMQGGWNGMNVSGVSLRSDPTPSGDIVVADVAQARYLWCRAMEDVAAWGNYDSAKDARVLLTAEELRVRSPDLVNVSLVAPVRHEGKLYWLAQIKGDAKGSGEIHTGVAAGGLAPKYLSAPNPLVAQLQHECSKELGLDLTALDYSSAAFMVDERFQGMINFAHIARGIDMDAVLSTYEGHVRSKEKPEVAGLALVPLEGAVLHAVDEGVVPTRFRLDDVVCYVPGKDGLDAVRLSKVVRPYTEATTKYAHDKDNLRFLLEKAGF